MARKVYTAQEQAKIDARTLEVKNAKDSKLSQEKNKKLMYIGGAVLVVGIAIYLYKKV